MNWPPTLWVLAAYLAVIGLYLAAYHGLDHQIGWDEIGKRWELIRLAATGNDYRQPQIDPGMYSTRSWDTAIQADDPITAILVRASEAERRWYALHHLLDQWEQQWKHQMMLQPQEEQIISRFLFDKYREAQREATDQIQSRIRMHQHRDEDGMATQYIIEDQATGYQQRVKMADVEVIRFDDSQQHPPPVQQRIDTFPAAVLREVEQRSDTLKPRV